MDIVLRECGHVLTECVVGFAMTDPEFYGWHFKVFRGKTQFVGMAKDGPWKATTLTAAIHEEPGKVHFAFGDTEEEALTAVKQALRAYLAETCESEC